MPITATNPFKGRQFPGDAGFISALFGIAVQLRTQVKQPLVSLPGLVPTSQ